MPLLPVQNASVSAPDLGQGPSVARAGDMWDQVGQIGHKIQSFSEELAYKRKEAETKSYMSSSANDLERFASEKETELAAKYTGDPTGAAKEMNEALNDWHLQRQDSAPNDDAKNMWETKFGELSNQIGMKADAWENKKRVDFQIGRMDDDVVKNAQHLAQKPDVQKAAQFINNTHDMVNNGVGLWFDETQAKDRMQAYGATHAKALMEGLEANKQYGAALNIFSSKDPNSKIVLSHMTPDQIGMYKDRFSKLQKAENEVSKSMFNLDAGDTSLALQKGMDVDDTKIAQLVQRSSMLKPDERKVFLDDLNSDLQYNQVLKSMKNLPMEDIQSLKGFSIKREGNDIFNFKSRTEKQEMFQKVANELIDKRINKAPDYHYEMDSQIRDLANMAKDPQDTNSINAYTKAIVAKQMTDKAPSISILNESLSKNYAEMLKSNNPKMIEQAYQGLRQGMQIGDRNYARNAIADMVKYKHLTPVQGMALSLEDPQSRESALANIAKKADIDSQYAAMKKASGDKENEFEVLNDSEVNKFRNAIINGTKNNENVGVLEGFNDLLVNEYKSARINGAKEGEAKKRAIESVIKNNFSIAKGGNSQLILGKEYQDKKDDIEKFLKDSMQPKVFKAMNIVHPPIYDQQMELIGKKDEARQRYYEDLSKNGEWVMNSAQNGAILMKREGKGRAKVLDANGQPISLHFDKMKDAPKRFNAAVADSMVTK